MAYIWINPVVDRLYPTEVLDTFLRRLGHRRVEASSHWGQVVQEKYRAAAASCPVAVADMRCPVAQAMVAEQHRPDLFSPAIEPILIHCARELAGRADLADDDKLITTPCQALADLGNQLNLPRTRFVSWRQYLQDVGPGPEGTPPAESPIPPGFFDGLGLTVQSISGPEELGRYLNRPTVETAQLVELLYCHRGCHNGDGIVANE